jgi:hypothetical protein
MNLRRNPAATRRRGVILLVVLAMLTLFAIAGITFVLYANAAAESARISRDAESYSTSYPDMDPNTSFNIFLSQLVYGVTDDQNGVYSALRGHSLAETEYGSWDATGAIPSDVPFDGTGRLREPNLLGTTDGYNMVNYMLFTNDGNTPAPGSVLRDPSRITTRATLGSPRTAYTGGQNAPYTYPDLNNMFLATQKATDGSVPNSAGTILQPSYFRSWTGIGALDSTTNPNWNTPGTTNPSLKYLTLRPRPGDMPGFPVPASATGDVKNLVNAPGGNDSIWIDIGAPTLSTAAGLRYKMLVAPLILDLDNRINLNVVGNILASGNGHASNQGWGEWEVNMNKVLNTGGLNEAQNLFLGNPPGGAAPIYGRYGKDQYPSDTFAPTGPSPHAYAAGDLNGTQDPAPNTVTGLYNLPGAGGNSANASFPLFPPGYRVPGGASEFTNSGNIPIHPMFFNLFNPVGDDRLFPLSAHASLMWAGINASPGSDLVRLCPTNFNTATIRQINQTTLLSMDLDRAGATSYVYDPTAAPYAITYTPTGATVGYTYGGSGPIAFQTLPVPPAKLPASPQGSEYDVNTWRSVLPRMLTRLNLNRPLTAYPAPAGNPLAISTTDPVYLQAVADRKQFASDIFNRLLAATGTGAVSNPPSSQYASQQWLAQLAVNIVDYIDTDDYMTPFQWTTSPQAPDTGYVFGTELPKLVLNEAYVQYNNTPGDPFTGGKAQQPYQMNVWVELLNPLPSTPDANGPNNAQLQNGANNGSIYQVLLTKPNTGLRSASNVLGDPDATAGQVLNPTAQINPSSNFSGTAAQQVVTPVGTAYSDPTSTNVGFYVLGPAADTTLPATLQSANMTYQVQLNDPNRNTLTSEQPTIILRRLANEYLPYNNTPGPNYNPYVTVDYVENVPVQDARTNLDSGANGLVVAPKDRFSYGRTQPFAGVPAQLMKQAPNPANTTTPQNTFYRHNANASTPANNTGTTAPAGYPAFDWLVHLDRPLISPIELLNVSGFKPHELTQQFIDANGTHFGHLAPWKDENARLYRLLEFVKAGNGARGVVDGGRVPGKININTLDINDMEVFRALCDAQQGNRFYYDNTGTAVGDGNVDQVFKSLIAQRTPTGAPGATDKPFWGMALGAASGPDALGTTSRGIGQTLLAPATAAGAANTQRLLTPTNLNGTPPYQQMELLNKIFNNTTTRSNTFAVWLTVGFFPITNDQVQPNQLGPEINATNGRNIRHHMFAIVDRTQIVTFGSPDTTNPAAIHTTAPIAASPVPQPPVPLALPSSAFTDARTGRVWQIQQNSTLVYDPGMANEETVLVQGVAPAFTANFTQAHGPGANVISRGHPGPINTNTYNLLAKDGFVIPYSVIID